MKKLILIITAVLFASSVVLAQTTAGTEVTGEKRTALVTAIEKAHKQLSTLSANFTQEKKSSLLTEKVTQKGKMMYKSPKQLRWEYTSPKATTVIFTNGKVLLKTDKGTACISVSAMWYAVAMLNSHALSEEQEFALTAYYYYYHAAENYNG